MVLDEVAGPDTAQGANYDPYASSPGQSSPSRPDGYALDKTQVPHPFSLFALLYPKLETSRDDIMNNLIKSFSSAVQRPLTKDECDSIGYHVYKSAAIVTWARPVGFAWGAYRYYSTRDIFRFPLYTPAKTFDKEKLLFLRGQMAANVWKGLRFTAHVGLSTAFLGAIIGSFAATSAAVGQERDPRMKDILESLRGNGGAAARARATPGYDRRQGSQRGGNIPESGSIEDYGGVMPEEGGQESWGTQAPMPVPAPQSARWTPRPPTPAPAQRSEAQDIFTGSPVDFDDASPTAGNPPMEYGSAWEKLRKSDRPAPGATSSAVASSTTRPQGSPSGNAWAEVRARGQAHSDDSPKRDNLHAPEEDGQRARAKAQAEFDAQLERERKGESNGPRRWG